MLYGAHLVKKRQLRTPDIRYSFFYKYSLLVAHSPKVYYLPNAQSSDIIALVARLSVKKVITSLESCLFTEV